MKVNKALFFTEGIVFKAMSMTIFLGCYIRHENTKMQICTILLCDSRISRFIILFRTNPAEVLILLYMINCFMQVYLTAIHLCRFTEAADKIK